jgi:lipoprotein-anchoring transpeptidase ErfK/SrfK
LFQLYSFFTSTCPLGLNGPFSEKAPTPSEEHPGPTPTSIFIQRNLRKRARMDRYMTKFWDQGFHEQEHGETNSNFRTITVIQLPISPNKKKARTSSESIQVAIRTHLH